MAIITKAGADPATVEIAIEIESQKNILRAIATGATELRTKERNAQDKTEEELLKIVGEAVQVESSAIHKIAAEGRWNAYEVEKVSKRFFGLMTKKQKLVRMVDCDGVIRLQKDNAKIKVMHKKGKDTIFSEFIDEMTQYTDAGATLPKTYLFFQQKMADLSGVISKEQLMSLVDMELEFLEDEQELIVVVAKD
jgi:hypothetical protein